MFIALPPMDGVRGSRRHNVVWNLHYILWRVVSHYVATLMAFSRNDVVRDASSVNAEFDRLLDYMTD